ncbi:MAG: AsmA family protein [Gammaproteobacteria bacterium]|nr:AsmA family protein [Gammaproteobacteria bacterium]
MRKLIIFVAVFGLIVGISAFIDVTVTSETARRILVEKIKSYSGRNVRIDGEVLLKLSLFPRLLLQRVHISNVDGFEDENFISVSEVRIDVSLMQLLSGQLHLSNFSADQAKINLIKKNDGRFNWSSKGSGLPLKPIDTVTADRGNGASRFSIAEFQLTNVAIRYYDESRDRVINKQLEQLLINLSDTSNPVAEITGDVMGQPYNIAFKSTSLDALLSAKPWLLEGAGHIANRQTKLKADVQLTGNEIKGTVDINVSNINLGLLLDRLGIISAQEAATENIHINAKLHGSGLIELYEQAEIKLQLGEGYWNLYSADTGRKKQLTFTRATSFTAWKKPLELQIDGSIAGEAVKIDFKTNPLQEFFDEVQTLNVNLNSRLAETSLNLKGTLDLPIKTKQFQLDISVKGKDLERLNPIINSEFPPLNDFELSGNFIANDKGYVLKSARASIGETSFQTSMVIQTKPGKPHWFISLRSQQLQLKDFSFDDSNSKQTEAASAELPQQVTNDNQVNKHLQRLEKIVRSPGVHYDLNLKVDRVLSGEDILGRAEFQLHLRDNAISLKNADIKIPGGKIKASLSLETQNRGASGYAKLEIVNFDYGITTRLFEPDSLVDGIISVRTDLQIGGSDFTRMLDHATGQLDFAVWPENTKPVKALNLWTTNLFLMLLPKLENKESSVNCMVGLMNLEDGTMKEELLSLDTTKLWLYGNVDVNFKQKHIKLSLFPLTKTAIFFALQLPIRAEGSFSNISLVINPLDLAGSYISFITSPLHVPVRRIFSDKVIEDGSAICEQLFDRNYVEKLKTEVVRKHNKEVDEMLESY